jgi:MATE family multidrug resistance protein
VADPTAQRRDRPSFGLIILLLQAPIGELGFAMLSAEPDVREAGIAFYNARIWGAPAVMLNLVLMGWFLGREKGRRVIALSMVGNGSNVVFNYMVHQPARLGQCGGRSWVRP